MWNDEQWKVILREIRRSGPIADLMDRVREVSDPDDDEEDDADESIYCPTER